MDKVAYMDEEILKLQITENSKLIEKFLKEFNESISQLTSSEKAISK
ncbi:MAG: hypothetical protein ACYDG2_26650 [Ruminiclostridium sp.]